MTRTIDNFQVERLEQAMRARACTAVELAGRVNVTPTTISRWKSGTLPTGELLFRVAEALRVTPQWLTRPVPPRLGYPHFRGSVAQMKSDRELLDVRINWLAELAGLFEAYVDYPAVNVPRRTYTRPGDITDTDIEAAAAECRALWGLKEGPIADVVLLLENAGVIVAREETGAARIEGLSTWGCDGRPYVLLCADKANGFRSRFDAAHELGHLILHPRIAMPVDAATYKLMELQAHRFASAFLMPEKTFVAEVPMPVSLQGLLLLKKRWGVSVGAMIMRLKGLKLISEAEYLRLIKLRSAKWGSKQEPLDDEREPEQPRLLRRTADLLCDAGVLSYDGLSEFSGLSEADTESLLGLGWGALSARADNVTALPSASSAARAGDTDVTTAKVLPFRPRGIS
jgi:Zn-dependent peptidase ImmA (M78 family)